MSRHVAFAIIGHATLIAAATVAVPASAQSVDDATAAAEARGRVTAGFGVASVPSYIGSDHSIVVPTTAAQGQLWGMPFQIQGTSASLDVVRDNGSPGFKLQVGPVASLRLDRTGGIHDGAVQRLGARRRAIELGGWLGLQKTGVFTSPYDTLSVSASYQHDVGGAHDSYIVSPELDYATPLSHKLYASLALSGDYVGRRFGSYYYDVDAEGAAASGLPTYGGASRAGWKDWNASILVARSLTGDLTHGLKAFGTAGYQRLLGRYERSPVVAIAGRASQLSYALGLGYTF